LWLVILLVEKSCQAIGSRLRSIDEAEIREIGMQRYFSLLAVLLLLLVFSVEVFAQDDLTIAGAVEAAADDESEFTILFQLLDETALLETLDDSDAEFTVFAPTDEAFEALLDELELDVDGLLEDSDAVANILLYHVVEGALLSEDLEDDMELETLNGGSIVVTVNRSGDITLDELATVVEPDLEASNGVIHIIDGVLLPPDEESSESGGGESCLVFTEGAEDVQVRVGPGENRGVVAFLPVNVEFEVLGQATDADDNVWFKLDKEEATPGRSNNEAWVSADDVETIGNCDDVIDVNAPPVIPSTSNTGGSSSSGGNTGGGNTGGGNTGGGGQSTGALPSGGTYTIVLDQFVNASCQGFQNIVIPSNEVWSSTVYNVSVSSSGSSVRFDGNSLTSSGSNYRGQIARDGYFVTIILVPVNSTYFVGQYIYSYNIESGGRTYACSDTTNFSATRN
jgi:uncharacterized surface protein with fasciclin (FAS1) repeats